MSRKPIGIIVYKGPSLIDKKPIIVVATGIRDKTKNVKIGNMLQFWILRRDISPILAAKLGEDFSICGDCKHRHFGSCYVNLCHGPREVYNAFHRDSYSDFEDSMIKYFEGKSLRIGAYGDPAAVPYEVWDKFIRVAKIHTGYTHQWQQCDSQYGQFLMASVDSEEERNKAQEMGWRTFRIRTAESDSKGLNEFTCPASQEGGKKTSCEVCGACSGLLRWSKDYNSCIIIHGGGATGFKVKRFIKGMKNKLWKKKWKKEFITI